MTMTPEHQRDIISRESAWIDTDSFGQLDLSAFPNLQPPPQADKHDDRFARDWRDTALSRGAGAMRQFLENPDFDAIRQIGEETGNANFLAEYRDRKGEAIAAEFRRRCPDYLATDSNYASMVETLSFNALSAVQQNGSIEEQTQALISAGVWTVENLTAAYRALEREGLLEVAAGTARRLTESERLKVMRLAQNGQFDAAIGEYLKCSLDGEEPTLDIITDPAYATVCNEAVLYVFEVGETSYTPTPERRNFILRYAAGRPLTLTLIQQAWSACRANEQRHERGELLDQYQRPRETEPPTPKQLDEMDDDAFDRLYHDSLRAYANSVRHPAGIIT